MAPRSIFHVLCDPTSDNGQPYMPVNHTVMTDDDDFAGWTR